MTSITRIDDFPLITIDDVVKGMEERRQEYSREPNAHRRKILLNYIYHAGLEISGRYEEILSPDLTVAEPRYEYFQHGVVHEGVAAVKTFYSGMVSRNATALLAYDQKMAVADWGFSLEEIGLYYLEPEAAAANGIPVRDGFRYIWHRPMVMVWHYTDDAKLIGERVYHAAFSSFSEINPEHYLNTKDLREALAPFIERARAGYLANESWNG